MEKKATQQRMDKPPEIISYYTMRRAIGILGITLPLILLAGSSLFGECREVQISISAYYHTNMRNVFVGINCAVALFMFAYRGHDWRDNLAGHLGCIFALGVAFLPCTISTPDPPCLVPTSGQNPVVGDLHNVCALLFFMILIIYTLFLFPKTHMDRITGEKLFMGRQKRRRNVVYYCCGGIMTLSLVLIVACMLSLLELHPGLERLNPVFWLESAVLVSFGLSWLTKGQLFFRDEEYKRGP
jgi:peptidoglycan/LPS O-acetylase OafA/YrhL